MSFLVRLALAFSLVVHPFAIAADGPVGQTGGAAPRGPHRVDVDFTVAPIDTTQPELTADALRALHEEAHEAFENEDPDHGFVRRWVEKFNYSKILLNAYRWYLMKSDGLTAADHIGNLAIMYLTSHGIETAGGGALASYALSHDFHWVVKTILTGVGVGISIPGLDPLCISLGFAYGKWPLAMNKGLQYPRIVIMKSSGFVAKKLGMQRFVPWLMTRHDAVAFMMNAVHSAEPGTYRFTTYVDALEFALLSSDGEAIATFTLQKHGDNGLAMAALTFSGKWDRATRRRLARQLTPFGYNVKCAVLEVFDLYAQERPDKIAKLGYVASVDGLGVQMKKPAVYLGEIVLPTALGKVALAASCAGLVYWYSGFFRGLE